MAKRLAGVVVASRARTVDLRGRGAQRIETSPDVIVDDMLARLAAILE